MADRAGPAMGPASQREAAGRRLSLRRVPIDRVLSERGVRLLAAGMAAVGYVLLFWTMLQHGIVGEGGGGAGDVLAYWSAGRHALEGAALYQATVGGYASYLYPPPFAQLLAPLTVIPFTAFVWLWRAVELISLRVSLGGWTAAGIAILLFPPVIAEIDAGNVHLMIAASCALLIGGRAASIVPAAAIKYATAVAVPAAAFRDRRGLMVGAVATLGVCIASLVLSPATWQQYVAFLPSASLPPGWPDIGAGIPLLPRLLVALAIGILAIRWIRLIPIAVTLAYPVVWFGSLSTLVAILAPGDRRPRGDAAPDGPTAA